MNFLLFSSIVTLIIFVSGFIIFYKIYPNFDYSRNASNGVFYGYGWAILLSAVLMYLNISYGQSISEDVESHKYYIESLGNDKYTQGNFGLFTGNIKETDYYFFYVKKRHGMKRQKIKVKEAYLIETDTVEPKVTAIIKKYNNEDNFFTVANNNYPKYYRIYVPKNTVIRKFKVR